MSKQNFQYLLELQYLGYRYHGWQKQPNAKTVQGMIDKTLSFVLDRQEFKTLGASRTDTKVSANHSACSLFTETEIDCELLKEKLNKHLPIDIRILNIQSVSVKFNIIKDVHLKEYIYLFSFGEKNHPFCAPMMVYEQQNLDIELMKQGAKLFVGLHNFKKYTIKPSPDTQFEREILFSEIKENDIYSANFFPPKSNIFQIRAKGFLRNQIRLMMGALFALGKGEITLEKIKESLKGEDNTIISPMASASGLSLNRVEFCKFEEDKI